MRNFIPTLLSLAVFAMSFPTAINGADGDFVVTTLNAKCLKCHGEKIPKGGVDLRRIGSQEEPQKRAELLQRVFEAVESNDMPPEGEPQLTREEREALLTSLKSSLKQATATTQRQTVRVFRLTRFQYNNAVRDLFQLNRDVFELP